MLIVRMKIRSLVDLSTFGYFCVPSLCAIFVVSPYARKDFFLLRHLLFNFRGKFYDETRLCIINVRSANKSVL